MNETLVNDTNSIILNEGDNTHLALYRKNRPSFFKDVIGQEAAVTTLRNQIFNSRLSHAYLFTGSRGTGKTTVAKIFAKAVNCSSPLEDGTACGKCHHCISMQQHGYINIIEFDAASNRGVDSVAKLREQMAYAPTAGQYKVFIIDEVHMLTTEAFNALLTTFEEPPKYVIFILATTDPQKIPMTILSRLQRFDFKRIPIDYIQQSILKHMAQDGVKITEDAARHIAALADGGMRDAWSLLDRCLSLYSNEEITLDKVFISLTSVDTSKLFDITESIINKDTQAALMNIKNVHYDGLNLNQFTSDLMDHMRNLLACKTSNRETLIQLIEKDSSYIDKALQQSQKISSKELIEIIKALAILMTELKSSSTPRRLIEISVIKLTDIKADPSMDKLFAYINSLEEKIAQYDAALNNIIKEKIDIAIQEIQVMPAAQEMLATQETSTSKTNNIEAEAVSGQTTKQDSQTTINSKLDNNKEEVLSKTNTENENLSGLSIKDINLDWELVVSYLDPIAKAVASLVKQVSIDEGKIELLFDYSVKAIVDSCLYKIVKTIEILRVQKEIREYSLIVKYDQHR